MKLMKLFIALSLVAGFSAQAQQDDSLPDLPVVNESAPQEPPFTQPNNEFDDAQKAESDAVKTSAVPVETSAPPVAPAPKKRIVKDGVEKIEHPLAAKGLIRIEKDGSYIYRTKVSQHNQSATFRIGMIQPPEIQSADGQTDFKGMYTSSNIPVFMFDYEWQPFSALGKWGVQAGFGFFTAQGAGRFIDGSGASHEKYTFLAFPLNLGLVYRMELSSRQWVAPYLSGGGTYFALAENRDDNKSFHGVGTPGAYGAGGLMFNISAMDRETAYNLDSEYGISALWLSLEYRYVKTFSNDLDLSSNVINVGFAVDY